MPDNHKVRMEIEVEYVRTEKIVFESDLGEGWGLLRVPPVAARLMRLITFHMHHNKNLMLHEKSRLIGWTFLNTECVCHQYPALDETLHVHVVIEGFEHGGCCSLCPCTYNPEEIADAK